MRQLAISDAHPGLKAAIARVLGSPWQHCTVHFLRDLRGHCRKDQHDALGALIRQIFTADSDDEARHRRPLFCGCRCCLSARAAPAC
jgi:putative transposase